MNIFLNEYFGFCFELNFELNHFSARFNEKMNFQNISNRAIMYSEFESNLYMINMNTFIVTSFNVYLPPVD